MKILAIDSSGLVASVAIVEDSILVAEYTLNYKKTHSQTLLPMLEEISSMVELDLSKIDAIAIASGPGSFTGLRIGAATAKGLGLAYDCPIIGVPTIHALAYNMVGSAKIICPLMDARRNQVYTGLFRFEEKKELGKFSYEMKIIEDQCVILIEEIIEKINSLGEEVIFLGDGVPVFEKRIEKLIEVPYGIANAMQNRQRAATVAVLSQTGYSSENARDHRPDYLRLSQAERERLEQERKNT